MTRHPDQEVTTPSAAVWSRLGIVPERRVQAGHQSLVYRAHRPGRGPDVVLAVKFVIREFADRAFDDRIAARSLAAASCPSVVGPKPLDGQLTTPVDQWLVVTYPWVEGTSPSTEIRDDVVAMAKTLADLHQALRAIGDLENLSLPPVRALRPPGGSTESYGSDPGSRSQLIHGDFAAANLIAAPNGLRVIDFDDCGSGSIDFDVGNSLYLVLFDAWNDRRLDRYQQFRSWFIDAYSAHTFSQFTDDVLDQSIRLRVQLLERWLTSPENAPLGIKTASRAWHRRLRSFIEYVDRDSGLG